MAKLVVLSEGFTGRSYELTAPSTTVGRVEDNAFQIPDGSVSSHHCEIVVKGALIVVKDLNSTNGTFINGQQVQGEAWIKPGQILRLGIIELRLEAGDGKAAPKKLPDQTMVIPQGVKLGDADQGAKSVAFDKSSPFSKKSNNGTKIFIALAIILGIGIIGVIIYVITQVGSGSAPGQ